MTPQQKHLVQSSFEKILPIAETGAALFYNRLFELDPSLRPLFKGDLREQGKKLMDMLRLAVKGLDNPDVLIPVLQRLGERHASYNVRPEHYETVGAALIWTLEQALGAGFDAETRQAWIETYNLVAGVMKDATVALV